MNPSWQVTKLIDATGRRPLVAYRSLDPASLDANGLHHPGLHQAYIQLGVHHLAQRGEDVLLGGHLASFIRPGGSLQRCHPGMPVLEHHPDRAAGR